MPKKLKVNLNVERMAFRVFLLFRLFSIINCNSETPKAENTDNNPCDFHIGGVLSSNESEHHFKQTIEVTYN